MACRRKINGFFYIYWSPSLIHWASGSLRVFLLLQMVSLVLHLIKVLQHHPVQFAFCCSKEYKFKNAICFSPIRFMVCSVCCWQRRSEHKFPLSSVNIKSKMNHFVLVWSTAARSNVWPVCSLRGLTSCHSLIQNVWHTWPKCCKQNQDSLTFTHGYQQQPALLKIHKQSF